MNLFKIESNRPKSRRPSWGQKKKNDFMKKTKLT